MGDPLLALNGRRSLLVEELHQRFPRRTPLSTPHPHPTKPPAPRSQNPSLPRHADINPFSLLNSLIHPSQQGQVLSQINREEEVSPELPEVVSIRHRMWGNGKLLKKSSPSQRKYKMMKTIAFDQALNTCGNKDAKMARSFSRLFRARCKLINWEISKVSHEISTHFFPLALQAGSSPRPDPRCIGKFPFRFTMRKQRQGPLKKRRQMIAAAPGNRSFGSSCSSGMNIVSWNVNGIPDSKYISKTSNESIF
jgi:hypothetical protein